MKRSTLIQRCYYNDPNLALQASLVATGGDTKLPKHFLEGFSRTARQSFDYMGRAEFEFGALGLALRPLIEAHHHELIFRQIHIHPSSIRSTVHHDDELRARAPHVTTQDVYYLCLKDQAIQVKERLLLLARNDRTKNSDVSLQEPIHLSKTLKYVHDPKHVRTYETWIEMDNGYIFTTSLPVSRFLVAYFDPTNDLLDPRVVP